MEKLILLINHPLDGMMLLIGGAIASIFGTAIKDSIMKILSLFSLKFKKMRAAYRRKLHRQAHLLMLDSTYLVLYTFRAVRTSIVWTISVIICILSCSMVYQKFDYLYLKLSLGLPTPSLLDFSDNSIITLHICMGVALLMAAMTLYTGHVSSTYLSILLKAQQIRARQLRIDKQLK
ncbi:hypothetical protein [Kosakonia sacchari]|uniref:hypothetical protein n=1 Tax=Kosakonia sacchari TaxID=1158459 RepID=UPI0013645C08|nr:hypothetical protein [Kosakonia sacchari]QHM93321.1 hypothetical protein FGE25_03135 [Kosakonia sacchari]